MVVNEALGAGLPVLGSTYSQAVMEMIEEGYNGWIWDPEESTSLYAAMTRICKTEVGALRAMAENARASLARFSPEYVADHLVSSMAELN